MNERHLGLTAVKRPRVRVRPSSSIDCSPSKRLTSQPGPAHDVGEWDSAAPQPPFSEEIRRLGADRGESDGVLILPYVSAYQMTVQMTVHPGFGEQTPD